MIDPLIANLRARDVVSAREVELLRSIIVRERRFGIDEDLVTEGSRPTYSTLLLDGFAARYRIVDDGRRQITALHIAGDFVDLHAFPLKKMDHGIVALTPCHVALADHSELKKMTETEPHLTRLLWLLTLVDGAIHREWIVAMGRRSKVSQIAHIFCELFARLEVIGRVKDGTFALPLTQQELADTLGMSLVHLNKSLKLLHNQNTVKWTQQAVKVIDMERLARTAEFDPGYLNLHVEPR